MVKQIPNTIFVAKDHSKMLVIVPADPRSVMGRQYKDIPIMAMAYEIESKEGNIKKYSYTGLKVLTVGALKAYFHF